MSGFLWDLLDLGKNVFGGATTRSSTTQKQNNGSERRSSVPSIPAVNYTVPPTNPNQQPDRGRTRQRQARRANEPVASEVDIHPEMEMIDEEKTPNKLGRLVAVDRFSQLKIYVQRTQLKRHPHIRFQNHLYRFQIVKPQGYKYSVKSVSETLEKALANTIRMVQEGYTDREEDFAQLFVVLKDHGIVKKGKDAGNIIGEAHCYNSGHYKLWQDAGLVAKEILEKISLYFQSNKNFKLEHGLYFSMTVVHAKKNVYAGPNSQQANPRHIQVGAEETTEEAHLSMVPDFHRKYLLKRDSKTMFNVPKDLQKNQWCLPLSLLYGHCRAQRLSYDFLVKKRRNGTITEEEIEDMKALSVCKFRKLYFQMVKQSDRNVLAIDAMIQGVTKMLSNLNMPPKGPYSFKKDGVKIADYLNVQFYVYSRIGMKKIFEYPITRNIDRAPLMLYYEEFNNTPIAHISLILKLSFFNYHYFCPFCNRRVTHSQAKHYCFNTCVACRGFLRRDKDTKIFHQAWGAGICDIRGVELTPKSCEKCNVKCHTLQCYEKHKKSSVCAKGFSCLSCGNYERKSGQINNLEDFNKHHDCDKLTCRLCYEDYIANDSEEPHLCKLKKLKAQTYYPNLGFFDTETVATSLSPESCMKCVDLELHFLKERKLGACSRKELFAEAEKAKMKKKIRCEQHKNSSEVRDYHYVNALSFYFEDGKHGNFSRIGFFDPSLQISNDCVKEDNVLTMNYLPPGISKKLQETAVRSKGRFARGHSVGKNSRAARLERLGDNVGLEEAILSNSESEDEDEDRGNGAPDAAQYFGRDIQDYSLSSTSGKRFRSKILSFMPVQKFLLYILRPEFRNYTILSHNGQGFDHQLLVEAAYNLGLTPEILSRGQKLMAVTFPAYNIRFTDFMLYKSGSLAALAKRAKMEIGKFDFPYKFNIPANYDYIGIMPDNSYYGKTFESEESKAERNIILDKERIKRKKSWNFKEELIRYVHQDVDVLVRLAITFAKECFAFQTICQKHYEKRWRENPSTIELLKNKPSLKFNDTGYPLLHPYGVPFITLSGYVFGTWRYYELESYDLYTIPDEKGSKTVNTSRQEHEWIMFLTSLDPEMDLRSAYTARRSPSIGIVRPDYYIPLIKAAGFFHGCAVHGHFDSNGKGCRLIPGASLTDRNMFDIPYSVIAAKEQRHKKLLSSHGIQTIDIMHECEWQRLSKGQGLLNTAEIVRSEMVRDFLDKRYKERPMERLATRIALRGGRVECFDTTFRADNEPSKKLAYVDYNSLYPSVCTDPKNLFPTGKPETIIRGKDLAHINITNNGCFYRNKQIHGLAHVRVRIKPTMHPFLQYRARGKSIGGICCKCVEDEKKEPCTCLNHEKTFVSVWTLAELSKAVSIGDHIEDIYEVLAYHNAEPVLKAFLDMLSSYKIRHTKFAEKDRDKLKIICDNINEMMGFTSDELRLTPEMLEEDDGAKTFYKLWANALLGKFSQDNDRIFHRIIGCQAELDNLFNLFNNDIVEIIQMGPVLQVGLRRKASHVKPNMTAQVVIGSHVTAYARIEMQQHFEKLVDSGAEILYTDTDSALLKLDKTKIPDLVMGNSYREWKDELPNAEIKTYDCLGPKSYSYTYLQDGVLHDVVKCKGFSLWGNRHLQSEDISAMVEERAENSKKVLKRTIPQFHISTEKKCRKLYSSVIFKTLSSDIMNKRIIIPQSSRTLPFGYTEEMINCELKRKNAE